MSSRSIFPALRALRRLADSNAAAYAFAFELDSQFDGGEFSGPAIADAFWRDQDRLVQLVASRFGCDPRELDRALFLDSHDHFRATQELKP